MGYETEQDVLNEKQVMERLEKAWGVTASRLGQFSCIDFYFHKNSDLVGFGEIKCRKMRSDTYGTTFLTLRKYFDLIQHAMLTNKKAIFLASFHDCIKYIDVMSVNPINWKVQMAGRKDRGRGNDFEPMILVPIDLMETLD